MRSGPHDGGKRGKDGHAPPAVEVPLRIGRTIQPNSVECAAFSRRRPPITFAMRPKGVPRGAARPAPGPARRRPEPARRVSRIREPARSPRRPGPSRQGGAIATQRIEKRLLFHPQRLRPTTRSCTARRVRPQKRASASCTPKASRRTVCERCRPRPGSERRRTSGGRSAPLHGFHPGTCHDGRAGA
jgi:hypothetical protein